MMMPSECTSNCMMLLTPSNATSYTAIYQVLQHVTDKIRP